MAGIGAPSASAQQAGHDWTQAGYDVAGSNASAKAMQGVTEVIAYGTAVQVERAA